MYMLREQSYSNTVFTSVLRSCNSSLFPQVFLESCIARVKQPSLVNLKKKTVNVTNNQVRENISCKKDLPFLFIFCIKISFETNNSLTVPTKQNFLVIIRKETSHQNHYYSHRIGTKSFMQGFVCKTTSVIPRALNFASSSRKISKMYTTGASCSKGR